jgi:photosystem II stability/assembly factor-like uncharacterized protein
MTRRSQALTTVYCVLFLGCSAAALQNAWMLSPSLTQQTSGTDALLIAVSVVNRDTVWVAGAKGTYVRTTDGGVTWRAGVVPGADSLQFRDVHGVSGTTAYLLSIGKGDHSRIYKTTDAGVTWTLQFTNADRDAFYDCFGFWDAKHGIAFSDSHDGGFPLIATANGGATWAPVPSDRLPPAAAGEGGFASSGTCLVVHGESTAWVGTGASAGGARVLRTTDRGRTWSVAQTPLVRGASAGISTLTFRDAQNGAALGGDMGNAGSSSFTDNVALTHDGGATWTLAARPPFSGGVYGSAYVPGATRPTLVAVGPKGLAYSTDGAATWVPVDTLDHWGVAFASPDRGWAVGSGGRISMLSLFRPRGSEGSR